MEINKNSMPMLFDAHRLFLEALRQREQEILQFLAILVPGLGGFIWLLRYTINSGAQWYIFAAGTIGVLLLLLLGAVYSLALGYNYRYIVLELAKLEALLEIKDAMLKDWPRSREVFLNRYKLWGRIPWCTPPEVIKFFWLAFVSTIAGVTIVSTIALSLNELAAMRLIVGFGAAFFAAGIIFPVHFGSKLLEICKKEPDWKPISQSEAYQEGMDKSKSILANGD